MSAFEKMMGSAKKSKSKKRAREETAEKLEEFSKDRFFNLVLHEVTALREEFEESGRSLPMKTPPQAIRGKLSKLFLEKLVTKASLQRWIDPYSQANSIGRFMKLKGQWNGSHHATYHGA